MCKNLAIQKEFFKNSVPNKRTNTSILPNFFIFLFVLQFDFLMFRTVRVRFDSSNSIHFILVSDLTLKSSNSEVGVSQSSLLSIPSYFLKLKAYVKIKYTLHSYKMCYYLVTQISLPSSSFSRSSTF